MKLYEFFIGLRYLKSKKAQGFISFNTLLSIFIVFIGVFILTVVLSVMNGFQAQIKDKILDVDSHITVSSVFSESTGEGIRNYNELTEKIIKIKGVKSAEPFLQGQGLIRYRSNISYVMIRGMGKKGTLPPELSKFVSRSIKGARGVPGIYIGEEMASNYNVKLGNWIELIVPKGRLNATEGVEPGLGKFKVLGFFKSGYYEFDTRLVFMSLPASQRLFHMGNVAWGIGVKVNDLYDMDIVSSRIQAGIGFNFSTMTAEQKNRNLFYALRLEKLIMTIILFLVIVSAGFTIMGTLVMVVMEKRKAIGILKSMGARPNSIMIIFVLEGFLIGVVGSLLGTVLGLAASLNLEAIIRWVETTINEFMNWFYALFSLGDFREIVLVPTHVYYIDSIPTEVQPEFVVFIAVFAIFLSTIAAVFPAWSASRMRPVETIRYE